MSDEPTTLESCIGITASEGFADEDAERRLRAELHELRRAKWNWDEARAIVARWGEVRGYTLTEAKRDLAILVAGDGDAEWASKPHAPKEVAS